MGESDNRNVSSRFREGYVLVRAEDHKDLQILTDKGSEFADNIEVGGLVLCKTSVENKEAREEYYGQKAQTQMDSVDNNLMRSKTRVCRSYDRSVLRRSQARSRNKEMTQWQARLLPLV